MICRCAEISSTGGGSEGFVMMDIGFLFRCLGFEIFKAGYGHCLCRDGQDQSMLLLRDVYSTFEGLLGETSASLFV